MDPVNPIDYAGITLAEKFYEGEVRQNFMPPDAEFLNDVQAGLLPKASRDGTSGAYFMLNEHGKEVAIFKPRDEEMGCFFNRAPHPRRVDQGMELGSGCFREVFAYCMDRQLSHDFRIGVPCTILVKCSHDSFNYKGSPQRAKLGSLQKFVPSVGSTIHESFVDLYLPLTEARSIHLLAIFDIRTGNIDRSEPNILFDASGTLYPIDHGCIYPHNYFVSYLCWAEYAQAKLKISQPLKSFILEIDANADIRFAKSALLRLSTEQEIGVRAAICLLKEGCVWDLTFSELGSLMASQLDLILEENGQSRSELAASCFQYLLWDVFSRLGLDEKHGWDTPPNLDITDDVSNTPPNLDEMNEVIISEVRKLIQVVVEGEKCAFLNYLAVRKQNSDYLEKIKNLREKYTSEDDDTKGLDYPDRWYDIDSNYPF